MFVLINCDKDDENAFSTESEAAFYLCRAAEQGQKAYIIKEVDYGATARRLEASDEV